MIVPDSQRYEDAMRVKKYSADDVYNWICFMSQDFIDFAKELRSWDFTGEDVLELTKEEFYEGFHALPNEALKGRLWDKFDDIQQSAKLGPVKKKRKTPPVQISQEEAAEQSKLSKKRKLLEMVQKLNKKLKPNPVSPKDAISNVVAKITGDANSKAQSVVAKLTAEQNAMRLFGPPVPNRAPQTNVTHVRYTFNFPSAYQYILKSKPWFNPVHVQYRENEDKVTLFGPLEDANQAIDILYQQSIGQLTVTDTNAYFANAFDFYTPETTLRKLHQHVDVFIKCQCSWNVLLDDSGQMPKDCGVTHYNAKKIGLRLFGNNLLALFNALQDRGVRLLSVHGRYLFVSPSPVLTQRVKSDIKGITGECTMNSQAKVYFTRFPSKHVHASIIGNITEIWTVLCNISKIEEEWVESMKQPAVHAPPQPSTGHNGSYFGRPMRQLVATPQWQRRVA